VSLATGLNTHINDIHHHSRRSIYISRSISGVAARRMFVYVSWSILCGHFLERLN
jgi:hypothetical protein